MSDAGQVANSPLLVYTEENGPPGPLEDVEFWVMPHPAKERSLSLLGQMPRLRVVQLVSSGVDHVLPYLPPAVVLCNAPHLRAEATAEAAMCLMLASLNHMAEWMLVQQRMSWSWLGPRPGLVGKTALLVGYGAVGQALHRMLSGFRVDVLPLALRRRTGVAGADELPRLLPQVDVVVIAAPLTERTRGLFGRNALLRMKPGALLVNVSRGELVDTEALVEVLAQERITAALDVTDPEPLPPGHALWRSPGLVLSPHVGGNSAGLEQRATAFVAEQIGRYVAGEELRYQVRVPPAAAAGFR